MKDELVQWIRKLSYQKKEVTLASGRSSDFYIDMKNTLLHPRGIFLTAHLMAEQLRSLDGDLKGVGGLTMGADPIATALSLATLSWKQPLMAFYIRKEPKAHGTQLWVEGMRNFEKGDRVYILEDVVTTGGSSIKAVERARMAGLQVEGIYTVVDREEGGAETFQKHDLNFKKLITKTEILAAGEK